MRLPHCRGWRRGKCHGRLGGYANFYGPVSINTNECSSLSRKNWWQCMLIWTLSRCGSVTRLKVEQTIDPLTSKALIPPFSFQPLVENAVQHGIHSSPGAGRLELEVRASGPWLEISVSDDGQGVPSAEVERLFFTERPRVHALVLLRRRLQGLFGRSFQLVVRSDVGKGTTVTMRIPLRKALEVGRDPARAITADIHELVSN